MGEGESFASFGSSFILILTERIFFFFFFFFFFFAKLTEWINVKVVEFVLENIILLLC
jgi:hypothetical protein